MKALTGFCVLLFVMYAGIYAATNQGVRRAHYRHDGPALLNDLAVTPGAVRTTSEDAICHSGTTKQFRHTTESTKKQVYVEYGVDKSKTLPGTKPNAVDAKRPLFEIDHLISLELGGADTIKNLWPQGYYWHPAGAHEKDLLENELHKLVCSGEMQPTDAQKCIAQDWWACSIRLKMPYAASALARGYLARRWNSK